MKTHWPAIGTCCKFLLSQWMKHATHWSKLKWLQNPNWTLTFDSIYRNDAFPVISSFLYLSYVCHHTIISNFTSSPQEVKEVLLYSQVCQFPANMVDQDSCKLDIENGDQRACCNLLLLLEASLGSSTCTVVEEWPQYKILPCWYSVQSLED